MLRVGSHTRGQCDPGHSERIGLEQRVDAVQQIKRLLARRVLFRIIELNGHQSECQRRQLLGFPKGRSQISDPRPGVLAQSCAVELSHAARYQQGRKGKGGGGGGKGREREEEEWKRKLPLCTRN